MAKIYWNAGAVFGMCWLLFFIPIAIGGTIWFWKRRNHQPIKARLPTLIVMADILVIGFTLSLCIQRMFSGDFPCVISLWTSQAGLITLLNIYVCRGFVLSFTYRLTHERIAIKKLENVTGIGQQKKESYFYVEHRKWLEGPFLVKVFGTLTIIFLLPTALITAENMDVLVTLPGDKCLGAAVNTTDEVLMIISALYLAVFIFLALSLRHGINNLGFDAFHIREELRLTAVSTFVSFIPWYVFNNNFSARKLNIEIFPFSTIFIIIALTIIFCISTLWPLYKSIWQPEQFEMISVQGHDLNQLKDVLAYNRSQEAFRDFLALEFSPENLDFYLDVENYRKTKQTAINNPSIERDNDLLREEMAIYAKYIIQDAPLQVNLPYDIVSKINTDIHASAAKKKSGGRQDKPDVDTSDSIATVFDMAQRDIFHLMEKDSLQRFFSSTLYQNLVEKEKERGLQIDVLKDEGLVSDDKKT